MTISTAQGCPRTQKNVIHANPKPSRLSLLHGMEEIYWFFTTSSPTLFSEGISESAPESTQPHTWLSPCRQTDGCHRIKALHIVEVRFMQSLQTDLRTYAFLHMCALWDRYLALARAQGAGRLWHCGFSGYEMKCWKPPWVAGRTGWSGSPVFACSVRRERREIGESDICVRFLSSSVFRGTWQTTDSTSTVCLGVVSPPLCCRYLENCDPTTAVWEWTGNPAHSASLSIASFSSGMIVLWCTVHIFQITLSASPPTW